MTARVFPVDAVTGAPSYTGRALRQAFSVLLAGGTAARPFGAYSGVRPGIGNPASISGVNYTITPFAGVIDAETSTLAGPYIFDFDANLTGAVTAANSTNPRIDLLCVQLSDPAEADGTSVPGVALVLATGTAASTPSAPAVPARSMAVARVNVPTSGGGSPTITWIAPALGAPFRPVVTRMYNSGTVFYAFSTWTPMNGLDAATVDRTGLLGSAGGAGITVVDPGVYECQATSFFTVASAPRGVGVTKNSTGGPSNTECSILAGNANVPSILASPTVQYECVAGDVLRGVVYQQNVGANSGIAGSWSFSAKRIA